MPVARPLLLPCAPVAPSRSRRTLSVLVALVLATAALLGTSAAAAASPGDVVARLNGERTGAGLAPVQASSDLAAVAQRWAEHLASTGSLEHNPALADEVGGWSSLAENVGTGADVATVHGVLMASSGHRANILGSHTQVGAGVASGHGAVWVVQVFRTPSGAHPVEPSPAPPQPVEAPAPPPATGTDGPEPAPPDAEPVDEQVAEPVDEATAPAPARNPEADVREQSQDQASRTRPAQGHLVALDVVRALALRAHGRAVAGPDVGLRGVARVHVPSAV